MTKLIETNINRQGVHETVILQKKMRKHLTIFFSMFFSSGKNNLVNVMNLREKTESVAWMIQMPTNQSPNTYRRNVK